MNNSQRIFFIFALLFFSCLGEDVYAQKVNHYIKDIEIISDTTITNLTSHGIILNRKRRNEKTLPFHFNSIDQVFEVRVYLKNDDNIVDLKLIPTSEIKVVDYPLPVADNIYKFRIQFNKATTTLRPSIIIALWTADGKELPYEQQLMPFTNTSIEVIDKKGSEIRELYIGEEKEYEILTNHPMNIRVDNIWHEQEFMSWRVSRRENRIFLGVLPKSLNTFSTEIALETFAPNFLFGQPQYETLPLNLRFTVKAPRLTFLSTDKSEVVYDAEEHGQDGVEIQIQQNRKLLLNKTYRIEAQEEKGGKLVAELFTKNNLSNNRTMCSLRVYDYHNFQDGYLYIKDGDDPAFITNFSIISKTIIKSIQVLHAGKNWTDNLNVYPGETVAIKFEGEQMQHARYMFDGLRNLSIDSVNITKDMQTMQISIPININRKELKIFNGDEFTGHSLKVKEKQSPRNFDFVTIDYGNAPKLVSEIEKPIFYFKAMTDVILRFNPDWIDDGLLYGKQYITLDVRVIGPAGQLVEIAKDENIVICPGSSSPRYHNYEKNNCTDPLITLNKYLGIKTHRLQDWSKIEIYIKHQKDKYTEQVHTKKIEIYAARKSQFDVELSFPAGLLVKKTNEDDISSGISGISISAIAQFKFFKPGTIGKVRPYRIGVGSIALNAFNLSDNTDIDRDLGIVALGSVHPLQRPGRKLSLPLYVGFGYFLKADTFFWMIGPGISVSF
ncbi:hypothetical protein [Flammeovirga aprica]|uniref:Uncharacterized protein n=1 Tax=Flammeovirga aprica JL-4 TaxID=694437 RepID=A0A7X9XAS0_9BACT|nr:hypothetical protein [Flammeovirga aprica]NME69971.1 hypothetical protein [Flammeovirga aprica JL-4]